MVRFYYRMGFIFLLQGLFRKILTGQIKPGHLVQMSTEELASKALAMWREKETKHVGVHKQHYIT